MAESGGASGPDFSQGVALGEIPLEGTLSGRVGDDPALLMRRIAGTLRYRGPQLSKAERDGLAASGGAEAHRALAWDAHVARFLDDRPLPRDFESATLNRQLDLLAWSFHLPGDPAPPPEIPSRLADALAVDVSTRPLPPDLIDRHHALADYGRFLAHLPRR